MARDIKTYLEELKSELEGMDAALVQDALSDAEEFLATAVEDALSGQPEKTDADVLGGIIDKYGAPSEVAASYREMESRFPGLRRPARPSKRKKGLAVYFSVVADLRAWGPFLYMVLSFLTGSIYFGWALLGASVSAMSLILIVGIPLTSLFLLSVRGIALLEGRVVEALLGTRMPRKPLFVSPNLRWIDKLKALFTESITWKSLLYMIVQLPLGYVYFGLSAALLLFSLAFITSPVAELVFHKPLELLGGGAFTPVWLLPVVSVAGFFLLALTLHLAKWVGKVHGRWAKSMLVRK
jgi:uncharacterized membrane protein